MEYRRRILPWILMILGAVMALSAMLMLLQTPNVLQYTTLPPEAGEANATINDTLDKAGRSLRRSAPISGRWRWAAEPAARR